MAEIGLSNVTHTFGGPPILDHVDLQLEKGERVGLVGRNGAGKSTLLEVIRGSITPDGGEVARRPGLVASGLSQEVPRVLTGTVHEQLLAALGELQLEAGWEIDRRIDQAVKNLGLEPDAAVAELSAGSKRRVLLARAIVTEPDLLLLDEPTNHLDLETILFLEGWLMQFRGACVFVTHDRAFLRRVATRILDLDRGELRSYDCDHETYLERKQAELGAQSEAHAQFDKKLAKEEAWLKRGIKARRTRNMGRVRALRTMREERSERREEQGLVKAQLHHAGRTGQLVIRAKDVSHSFGELPILRGFSTEIQRGDRVGIIGPNGVGKTTLLQLLLGELEPQAGTIRHGTNLEVARFDQLHSVLDEKKTVQENVCDHAELITIGGRTRHLLGYLQDFLFSPEEARGPIDKLSGGARNRLQLARLLARPCNLLVLDEPTNDLDIETLELLEDLLVEYQGTLLIVSHDREFLDNVVTSTLVFEGEGRVQEYVGGYEDWQRQRTELETVRAKPAPRAARSRAPSSRPRRLTFKEKFELEALPARIEELEAHRAKLEVTMGSPEFYRRPGTEIAAETARFDEVRAELEEAYERWTLLEGIASGEVESEG